MKTKLELLAKKMVENQSQGSIVEDPEENSMEQSQTPRKEEFPPVKEFQINGKAKSPMEEKNNLEISTLYIRKYFFEKCV